MSTNKNKDKKKKLLFGTTQEQAEGFKTAANIANQLSGLSSKIADASPAKKYREAGVDKGSPVRAKDEDHSAAMSTETEYDKKPAVGKQQTSVRENGTDASGAPILTKKEKKLLEQDLNFTTM